jgi:hypothetical protein
VKIAQDVAAILADTGTDGVLLSASATSAQLVDDTWDEVITAHAVASSAGLYLTSLYQTLVTRIAQCGDAGTNTTIDLDATASAVNDFYKGQLVAIVAGTGIGQSRTCTGYAGDTKIATVHPAWATTPDGNSYFAVLNTGSTVVVDWADGGRLDTILDSILADTGTDGVKIGADAIGAANIADDAIAAEHIATGAIVAASFAADAITSTVIADNAITAAKLNADCITNAKIADDAIAAENIATNALAADGLAADFVDEILDEEVDNDGTAISLRGAMKLILAVLTGKSSGGGTATIVFRDIADSKNRISATVDADGNRDAVGTRDAT